VNLSSTEKESFIETLDARLSTFNEKSKDSPPDQVDQITESHSVSNEQVKPEDAIKEKAVIILREKHLTTSQTLRLSPAPQRKNPRLVMIARKRRRGLKRRKTRTLFRRRKMFPCHQERRSWSPCQQLKR